jgi:hypothetical protein
LLLGVGAYSYIAGWVLMPLFLMLTWIAQHRSEGRFGRASVAAGLGFLLPLVPLLLWLWMHPEVLRATIGRYQTPDPLHVPLGLSLRKFFNLGVIANRVSVYWDYFNPSFLFATGGVNTTASTGKAGVFLLPAAVFLPVGVYHALKHRAFGMVGILLIAAFAVAPLPATLAGERFMIQRELLVVPFGALVAAMGFAHLWRRTQFPGRIVAATLLAAMPLQFAYVYRDYLTHYQHRSVFYYDPAAFRQVAEYLIAAESSGRAPDVYLSSELDDVGAKWRFYATKARREDLLQRTRYFAEDGPEVRGIARGSLAVLYAESGMVARLVQSGAWSVARKVFDIDGRAASVILIKR